MSGCSQGLHGAKLSFLASIESPEGTLTADDASGGLAKGLTGAIVGLQCVIAQDLAARDFVMGC